ncbi:hypothetical protein PENSPDRAFT_756748 [Peniophora sp. CONT]|nr:hypothetical protein PENSPDRAFT_756748 [Peniophora sp. CONT]
MGAVDPSYPLYPIACVLASTMLILVLTTSFVRQSWNLGVAFLCFWLFVENLLLAVSAVVWSDNADIKLYVYCDIGDHIRGKAYGDIYHYTPALLDFSPPLRGTPYKSSKAPRLSCRMDTGADHSDPGGWPDLDINSFLRSNPSISRTNYLRILALANIDTLLTLPIGIIDMTLNLVQDLSSPNPFPLYPGWTLLHTDWEPLSISYPELKALSTTSLAQNYFTTWSSPMLAFTIFGLFGLTSAARASYLRIIFTICGWFGCMSIVRARKEQTSLGEIEFGPCPVQDTSGHDPEMGLRTPSSINTDALVADRNAERTERTRSARVGVIDSLDASAHEREVYAVGFQEKLGSGESGSLGTGQDDELSGGSTSRELDPDGTEYVGKAFGELGRSATA